MTIGNSCFWTPSSFFLQSSAGHSRYWSIKWYGGGADLLNQGLAEPPSMPPLFSFEFLGDTMIQVPALPAMGHGSVENFTGQSKLGHHFFHGQGRAGRASLVLSL